MFIATAGSSFINSDHIERITLSGKRDNPQRCVLHLYSGEQLTAVIDRAELAKLTGEREAPAVSHLRKASAA
ncbi:hypothetical protein [Mesorhizobium muleiense]|uniref:Uncharacterized protein n=1 Tax=Mesorhizobium muleiense TaxID=1004279 RepID=A0A1G8LCA7_9HYPH|nr:hypothetical protein [Mesorhizobium muleiense]MCF6100359.1 hypothetical protein [Mesorhizobium muleiense]SDI53253.1 hypothetical protein SAMN05428953_102203 [Mesorhizobium muleiense]